jgi:hypothetical protein
MLDDLFGEKKSKWTEDEIRREASKYNSRSEFQKGSSSAYQYARKLGMLDDLFPIKVKSLTSGEIEREAAEYDYPFEFRAGSPLHYKAALFHKMDPTFLFPERPIDPKWNKDTLKDEAAKYNNNIVTFKLRSPSAFYAAYKYKMLGDLFPNSVFGTEGGIYEHIIRILREETSSYDGDENGRYKVFYGFQGIPNLWSDDYGRVVKDSYFDDKVYNDYYFDNFYDMDKEFGHKESHFGTRGLPVGHPNRSSKSFDMYNDQYGPAIVRVVDETNL